MANGAPRSYRGYYFLIAIAIVALDQLTKMLIARNVPLNRGVTVIPGFFSLTHVLNRGAAFSMFANSSSWAPKVLIVFSCIVLVAIFTALWRGTQGFTATNLALSLIMGGATGNLIDRLRLGSVVDFLAFRLGSYYWPDFNAADSAIVIGSLLLVVELFFFDKQPAA